MSARDWRASVINAARRHRDYRGAKTAPLDGGEPAWIRFTVRRMVDDAADDVQRELDADCDPVALARNQAWLSLLLAFLAPERP
jgi:hypothetical protein